MLGYGGGGEYIGGFILFVDRGYMSDTLTVGVDPIGAVGFLPTPIHLPQWEFSMNQSITTAMSPVECATIRHNVSCLLSIPRESDRRDGWSRQRATGAVVSVDGGTVTFTRPLAKVERNAWASIPPTERAPDSMRIGGSLSLTIDVDTLARPGALEFLIVAVSNASGQAGRTKSRDALARAQSSIAEKSSRVQANDLCGQIRRNVLALASGRSRAMTIPLFVGGKDAPIVLGASGLVALAQFAPALKVIRGALGGLAKAIDAARVSVSGSDSDRASGSLDALEAVLDELASGAEADDELASGAEADDELASGAEADDELASGAEADDELASDED